MNSIKETLGYFKLDKPKSNKETLILFVYNKSGQRFVYSTGEKINPEKWDKEIGQPKWLNKRSIEALNNIAINKTIYRYKDALGEFVRDIKNEGMLVTPQELKKRFDYKFKLIEHKNYITDIYTEWIDELISMAAHTKTSISKYNTVKSNIKSFEVFNNRRLKFSDIGSFYTKYIKYARDVRKQNNNTLKKQLNVFKTFLRWAKKNGYTKYNGFEDWSIKGNDSEIIFLTEDELKRFIDADLSNNKRLEKVRDLFVFGCLTGGRFSDYSTMTKANIIEYDDNTKVLYFRPKKTGGKELYIPLHHVAEKILIKHDYNIPSISNQKFNDYLKELSELLEIDSEIKKVTFYGKENVKTVYKKYELITSHVARKTFVTLSLISGIRPAVVKSASGHISDSSFARYVGLSNSMTKNEFSIGWSKMKI